MNIIRLNTTAPDGFVKGGNGGGGGSTPSTPSAKWTGHADAEGLRAIGWTDEDIAYYQAHGVNWNAEDDEYHKVSEYDKNLYLSGGFLSKDKKAEYAYKKEISGYPLRLYAQCESLLAFPSMVITATSLPYLFENSYNLKSIGVLDCSAVSEMRNTFIGCGNLKTIILRNTENVTSFDQTFTNCNALETIEGLNISSKCTIFYACNYCYNLVEIKGEIDALSINSFGFSYCCALERIQIKNLSKSLEIRQSPRFSKTSLMYIIENEAATSLITITLHPTAYSRLAEDTDVVAALANHPNISISQ